MRSSRPISSGVLTHRFPLEQFDDALDVLQGSKDCGKVLIAVDRDHV
jgi:hypothetical protein